MKHHFYIPTMLRNIGLLAFADVFARAIGFVVVVYLTRVLGASTFGDYMIASAIAGTVLILATPGGDPLAIRTVVQCRLEGGAARTDVLMLRVIGGAVSSLLLCSAALMLPLDRTQAAIVGLHVAAIPGMILSANFMFQAQSNMLVPAMARAVQASAFGIGVVLAVKHSGDVRSVPILMGVSLLVGCAPSLVMLGGGVKRLVRPTARRTREIVSSSIPMVLSALLIMLYYSVDTIMIGWLLTSKDAGLFGAVYKVYLLEVAIAWFVYQGYMPILAKLGPGDAKKVHVQFLVIMSVAGLVVGGVTWALSPLLVSWMFGMQFVEAQTVFAILSAALIFTYQGAALTSPLQLWGLEGRFAGIVLFMLAVKIVGNGILLPTFGTDGAGWATVLSEVAGCVAGLLVLDTWTKARMRSVLMRTTFMTILCGVALILMEMFAPEVGERMVLFIVVAAFFLGVAVLWRGHDSSLPFKVFE